ncbi:YeiH family putative sulfate export transporter [Gordonia sp. TBRC 11910]|uniref:YeiH family putative sulfate export transporter n=1 Tax=Gordonia asplenii TaxID=2725283 RepID=A0A848KU92_9ACTN|nr:YeiH family protein [Gordonia asplenii]NMO00063.1 YeiH family putative sulfate export transporter [Gordonia asplenii]
MTDMLSTPISAKRAAGRVAPGLLLCAAATAAAMAVNQLLPTVSPLLIAILLGAVAANVWSVPQRLQPGIAFSAKKLLRLGVALLGLQLVLGDVIGLGWGMIVVVVAIVGLGIAGTMFVGKLMGIGFTQRVLIACGFSICGAAAVAATDGVIDADDEEVATSVALVVIFGTLMIPAIPLAAHALGLSESMAGLWAGGSIHEVAQVVAAGGAIGTTALGVAVIVKLARVMMLAPVMAVLSIRQRRHIAATQSDAQVTRPPLIPLFVVGFIAMMLLRSTSILPHEVIVVGKIAQTALLTAAMFALGLGIRIAALRTVGMKPVILATLATVWVSGIALVGVLVAGH